MDATECRQQNVTTETEKQGAGAAVFYEQLTERSSVLAIITHSNPYPVLSGLAFNIRRLCEALQREISDEIMSCGAITRVVKADIRTLSPRVHVPFSVSVAPSVAAALSVVFPIDRYVNWFVLSVVALLNGGIGTTDDDWVFPCAVKMVRTQWYVSWNHWRYVFPAVGGLFPLSFHRLVSRVSHAILRPHEHFCPVPLEYPADYVSLGKAVLKRTSEIDYFTLAKHLDRTASHYEGQFHLIQKIDEFQRQFHELIHSEASQVLVAQHQHQTQSQWMLGLVLSASVFASFKCLSVDFNFESLVDSGVEGACKVIGSAGSLAKWLANFITGALKKKPETA